MGYVLNYDCWDWVDPENQKVTKLVKGDEVPAKILDQEGIDKDELTKGTNPVLLSKEEVRESGAQASSSSATNVEPKAEANKK
jgi:hypothetical protein